MKLRMKISYSACLEGNTLNEHIMKSIIKTYDQRCLKGWI